MPGSLTMAEAATVSAREREPRAAGPASAARRRDGCALGSATATRMGAVVGDADGW